MRGSIPVRLLLLAWMAAWLSTACASSSKMNEAALLDVPIDPKPPGSTTKPRSEADQKRWNMLIGKYYGEFRTPEGERLQWTVTLLPEGLYRADLPSTASDGRVEDTIEVGEWGVSGPVIFMMFRGWLEENGKFRPSDPLNPYNNDAYRIMKLDSNHLEIVHFSTGVRYLNRRVASDFRMPGQGRAHAEGGLAGKLNLPSLQAARPDNKSRGQQQGN